jgi:aerobic carbon-monoxide dehydrogenase small subunit
MSQHTISVEVNGVPEVRTVESRLLLVHFLRDVLGLTGTHVGCDTTSCGACTINLDGRAVKSCTLFAVQADGRAVRTIEGLEDGDELHPLQEGFREQHGLQCGYCTPGMIMAALPLLESNADPDEATIRTAISGNLCRCTGYAQIVSSIQWAAAARRGEVVATDADADPVWQPAAGPLGH